MRREVMFARSVPLCAGEMVFEALANHVGLLSRRR